MSITSLGPWGLFLRRGMPLAALLIGLFAVSSAFAQTTKPMPPKETPEQIEAKGIVSEMGKLKSRGVSRMLQSGDVNDVQLMESYNDMRVRLFAHSGKRLELPIQRAELKRDLRQIGAAPDKKGLATLNAYYLGRFKEIVMATPANAYPPEVRINAMLAIGDLNSVELSLAGTGTPTAMPEALPVMMQAIKDPQVMDAVKAAAFVGVLRHTELGIADKQVEKQIAVDLLAMLTVKDAPINRSPEAHLFFRSRMIDVLAATRRTGLDPGGNDLPVALHAIAADANEPLNLRCDAARALGNFSYLEAQADPKFLESLGNLAVQITQEMDNPRGLRKYFSSVKTALAGTEPVPAGQPKRGLIAAMPAGSKKAAEDIASKVQALMDLVETYSINGRIDPLVIDRIRADGKKLGDWLKTNSAAAAATGG